MSLLSDMHAGVTCVSHSELSMTLSHSGAPGGQSIKSAGNGSCMWLLGAILAQAL